MTKSMLTVPPSAIALSSIFLYNCNSAIFAYLTNVLEMSMAELITFSTIPSLVGCSIYIALSNTPGGVFGPPGTRIALWAMALSSTLATVPLLYSLNLLTLSEHVSVSCLLPFVTASISYLWLGEKFSRTQAVCCRVLIVVICVAGVVMVVDPLRIREPADSDHDPTDGIPDTLSGKLIGVGVLLLGIFLRAPQFVIVRYVGDRATTVQMLTITYIVLGLSGVLLMLVSQEPVTIPAQPLGWSLVGILLTVGLVADASITYAGQRTSPTTVTICAYASVIFSNCIQWAIYDNHPSLVAFIGMFAILTAGLYGVIYGPAEESKESDAASVDSETAPLLHGNGARDSNLGSDRVPGV